MADAHYHSIRFDADRCNGCMSCLRVCPTQAIRVRRGRAVLLGDRCIDCSECMRVCNRSAIVPLTASLDQLARFDCTVAIPSPALYTQFETNVTPGIILRALENVGFDGAATLSRGCGAVTRAIEYFVGEYRGQFPLISSFCPSVVRLVQVKYPDLLSQLMPILSPREVIAREAKQTWAAATGLPPARIGTVYVTPCPAKLMSIVDHPGMVSSFIDSAVAIADVFPLLSSTIRDVQASGAKVDQLETAAGLGWAFSIGFPSSLPAENTLGVWGLANVVRLLDDVEKGKLQRYAFIECHACPEGCVSGALTVENPYVARARAVRLQQSLPRRDLIDEAEMKAGYQRGDFHTSAPFVAMPPAPLDREIAGAIARLKERDRTVEHLPQIDCGACGAPTCVAFAEDVVTGEVDEAECVFVREARVAAVVKQLGGLLAPQGRTYSRMEDLP